MVYCESTKLFIISAVLTVGASPGKNKILIRVPRQITAGYSLADPNLAATVANAGDLKGGGNYFQDIYVLRPSQQEIEYGLVFETPHVWQQRYERKDFSNNRHQGKLRWADEKGGRGEHYWDFNHAGPENDGGDDKERKEDDGENSDTAPVYANHQPATKDYYKKQPENAGEETVDNSTEAVSEMSTTPSKSFAKNIEEEIDGIGKSKAEEGEDEKRVKDSAINISDLFFQATNGQFVDKKTGKVYVLSPVN